MALTVTEAVRKWGPEYLAICGLAKYFPTMNSESHVFFVNADDGDDGVNTLGQRPDDAFLTITKAISVCSHQTNDYIFVLRYYQATGETWPIAIDKEYIHLIGITPKGTPGPWVQPPDNTAAITLSTAVGGATGGAHCEITGFEFGAGADHGCIEINKSACQGMHIHGNNFGSGICMTAKHGISVNSNCEIRESVIENNIFGKKLTADGIYFPSDCAANMGRGLIIRKNIFRPAGIGINIDETGLDFDEGGIFDNRFLISSDAAGKAIDIVAGVTGGLIDGNMAGMESNLATVNNNPYRTITACGPAWGLNRKGGSELAVSPALE